MRQEIATLSRGSHTPESGEGCLLEIVSLLAGEAWSDHPPCVCPVLTTYGIALNDAMPDNATRDKYLLPLVPLLQGTADPAKVESRTYHFADTAIRRFAPLALRAAGRETEAQSLEACEPVTDKRTAKAAARAANAAWTAALATEAAAGATEAAEATEEAARAAARAAGTAAEAAWTAAWAAGAAAWAAGAAGAAGAADRETVWELATQVYREAIDL